jgi:hypothetical protein
MSLHLKDIGDRLGCIHAAIPSLFIFSACAWLLIPSIQLYGRYDMVVLEIVWQLGFGVQLPTLFSSGW